MRRVLAVLLLGLVALTGCAKQPSNPVPAAPAPSSPAPAPAPSGSGLAWPADVPKADPVTCPAPTVQVSTADQLTQALTNPMPGTVIGLADGTYRGQFTATASGTPQAPIWLCGSADAVLAGPGRDHGMVLHLQQVQNWRLVGFSVTDAQKGVMADGVSGSVIQGLTVHHLGDEGIHLRTASTGNVVRDNTIFATGLSTEKYGEGIYVGTAVSNWCQISACGPDRSDHNAIVANTIHDTAAENVDIKEGTTGGVLAENNFNGAGMKGDSNSWVDVKGNGWLIQANRGVDARTNGYEVTVQAPGWGQQNSFDGNNSDVGGPGYGFTLDPVGDNRITCSNTVTDARKGMANTHCS